MVGFLVFTFILVDEEKRINMCCSTLASMIDTLPKMRITSTNVICDIEKSFVMFTP